jgi:hypothetical protein
MASSGGELIKWGEHRGWNRTTSYVNQAVLSNEKLFGSRIRYHRDGKLRRRSWSRIDSAGETRFITQLMSRILIADDQNDVLEALCILLKGEGDQADGDFAGGGISGATAGRW